MNNDEAAVNTEPIRRSSRIIELDALRALAAINLMLFHFTHVYQVKYGFVGTLGFELPYGKYGVQLFFMLSGFVNAMTLMRRQVADDFLVNRFLRIYPSFWAMIALNCLLVLVSPIALGNMATDSVFANTTALPNLLGYATIEPVTWTIQVEMLFYFVILLMFLTGSFQQLLRTIMLYVLLSLVGCLAIDYMHARNPAATVLPALTFLRSLLILDYFPLFAIGMLLHEVYAQRGRRWLNLVGVVLSVVVFHLIDNHHHHPIVTIGFIGLLTASAYGKLPFLRMRPFVFIAAISYALYLFHNNLGCTLIHWVNHAGLSPLFSIIFATAFTTLVAAAYTSWVERPMTRSLKRLWQSSKQVKVRHSVVETGSS